MVPGTTTAGHSTPPAVTGFSGDGGDLGDICTNTSDHVIPIHTPPPPPPLPPRHHSGACAYFINRCSGGGGGVGRRQIPILLQ